jgi:hypothetical protein
MEGGYCTETSVFYRDILETLNKVQHVVKATEFIGQTCGEHRAHPLKSRYMF